MATGGRGRGPSSAELVIAREPYGGSIELIIGPMFCEKSTTLIALVRRYALANQPALMIKYAKDIRYTAADVVTTHADVSQASTPGSEFAAPIRVVQADRLADVDVQEGVIGLDEGQFFPDLVECCERWANEGRRVIVAALDGTFARKPFGSVCELIPLCEQVTKLKGVCMRCRRNASSFSIRLGVGTEVVAIGGRELYQSACRACYFAHSADTL